MTATKKRNDNERITSVVKRLVSIGRNLERKYRTARTHIDVAHSRMHELGC